ncbi:uncharacterized protein LOC142150929 isoform X1 [Mixophyes fleayi]|uniref:uncharacterized protein LOC142150929 isoform X1 n=1 Tax=Mixophyes fleayi TaxID=3061075 RepID=UPI003F4E2BD1
MKNAYEQSLDESNTDFENPSNPFNEAFLRTSGDKKKNTHSWLTAALAVLFVIIFLILAILSGLLFGYYYTMTDELTVLKYNASNIMGDLSKIKQKASTTSLRNDDSELWKSVSNIMGDLSRIKQKEDNMINELTVLKYNASNSSLRNDVSELWKSVSNIMGDLSKIKQKVDTTEVSCKTCAPGWKLIRSNCYYFQSTATSWQRSVDECATRNAVLLVMTDTSEMNALLPTIASERYWIGLKRDPEDTDTWVWTDGTPLSFSAWNEGEPNNDKNNEHCAEILGRVQMWNDLPCDLNRGYICKGVWSC